VQSGPGAGIGGYVAIPPVSSATRDGLRAHDRQHAQWQDLIGGPGSMKDDHACDGKGIDYLGACAGG
jgi:hypothetical protein